MVGLCRLVWTQDAWSAAAAAAVFTALCVQQGTQQQL